MRRGDIYWADLGPPAGPRPVLVVSRSASIPVLISVVVAPISRTVRDKASEVRLGPVHGLPDECVANCDNLLTAPKQRLDPEPVGGLGAWKVMELDQALSFALEINF